MGHTEDLVKLRTRMVDAVKAGVVGDDADTYRMTLLQILNEAENKRRKSQDAIDNLQGMIKVSEGQIDAYSQIGSIIYAILDGYVKLAEKAAAEEAAIKKEKADREAEEAAEEAAGVDYGDYQPTDTELAEHGYPNLGKSRDDMTTSEKRADTKARKKALVLYREATG